MGYCQFEYRNIYNVSSFLDQNIMRSYIIENNTN